MTQSDILFNEAQHYIPGGVNSPVRAFKGVGGTPIFFKKGEGPYLISEDNQRFIDYVMSWGPLICGHAHPYILEKVIATLKNGLSFGTSTSIEIELSKKVCHFMPAIEKIRMVNSGTEATMSAIRLARGHTGRNKILKFEGCYHGHSDSLLIKSGSGSLTLGVPSSPGVPASFAEHTLTASFNNLTEVQGLFEKYGSDIAAIIVEPIPCNMNCVLPQPGFLQGLRDICDHYQSILIFDEVINGFRVGIDGAQGLYKVTPDLTTLGKIIGGGMPVGAFGGKAEIMASLAPEGPVYQAGTLSGNPVAMAAGLATLELISKPGFYTQLEKNTQHLTQGIQELANQFHIPLCINSATGLFGLFFTEKETVTCFADVMACDIELFKRFYHLMLEENIYLAPSAFEVGFISSAHTAKEIDETLEAFSSVFAKLAKNPLPSKQGKSS